MKKRFNKSDSITFNVLKIGSLGNSVEDLSGQSGIIMDYLFESGSKDCWIVSVHMTSGNRKGEHIHAYENDILPIGQFVSSEDNSKKEYKQKIKIITKNKVLKINQNF